MRVSRTPRIISKKNASHISNKLYRRKVNNGEYIGIDVGKTTLNIYLEGKITNVKNQHSQITAWVKKLRKTTNIELVL